MKQGSVPAAAVLQDIQPFTGVGSASSSSIETDSVCMQGEAVQQTKLTAVQC